MDVETARDDTIARDAPGEGERGERDLPPIMRTQRTLQVVLGVF
jgi:hypothetical protein